MPVASFNCVTEGLDGGSEPKPKVDPQDIIELSQQAGLHRL